MTTATFSTRDIHAAANETSNRLGKLERGSPKPDTEWDRVIAIASLAIGAMHHGEPTMQVSPQDWRLISDAFWDHKKGKLT